MYVCCGLTNHLELAKRADLYGGPVVVGEWEENDLAPVVEVRVEGIAWLDVSGVVMSGESIREARRRLRTAIGREPRLGLAPGPFSARVAAVRARPGRLLRVEDARAFLAPLPSRELPLDEEQLERLDLLGLRTLGAVAAIGA